MDDIALAASVSKGSLYNHFKDKEDLFQRLVEGVMVYDLNLATSDCPPHAAALQRLDQLLDALFWRVARICRDDGLIFNIWAAAAHGHSGFERAVSSAHQQWHEAIKDVLDDGRVRFRWAVLGARRLRDLGQLCAGANGGQCMVRQGDRS